ncbi:hypothetical protein GCM10009596_32030 [Arthrobacter rhombi]
MVYVASSQGEPWTEYYFGGFALCFGRQDYLTHIAPGSGCWLVRLWTKWKLGADA